MPPTQKAVFKMGDIVDFNALHPYIVAEVMCAKCLKRWLAVYPADTLLKDLECENCGAGYVIKTGQDFEEDDFDE